MLRFVLSSSSALLSSYTSNLQKPVRFFPERHLSQLEQQQLAAESIPRWVKDAETSIIYVVTHSIHFVGAAQLACLQDKIKPEQVSAVYLYQESEGGPTCEREMKFDHYGKCEPWPRDFMLEHCNVSGQIVCLRVSKRRALN